MTPYYRKDGFVLYRGDSLELLENFKDDSIDMVFADPPYFLSDGGVTCESGEMVSVDKGDWDEVQSVVETHEFNFAWLMKIRRILDPDGTLWASGTQHNIWSLGLALQRMGAKLLNDIAWFKVTPPPNLSCRYFTHGTETLIWAAQNHDSDYTFNYERMKELNDDKQMTNLWKILPPRKAEKQHGKHPTQKPLKLLDRIVLASTDPGDIVLDPFCGSSTTGIAAAINDREYIGIDQSRDYLDLSIRRYEDCEAEVEKLMDTREAR